MSMYRYAFHHAFPTSYQLIAKRFEGVSVRQRIRLQVMVLIRQAIQGLLFTFTYSPRELHAKTVSGGTNRVFRFVSQKQPKAKKYIDMVHLFGIALLLSTLSGCVALSGDFNLGMTKVYDLAEFISGQRLHSPSLKVMICSYK